jgi:hypothetical protein
MRPPTRFAVHYAPRWPVEGKMHDRLSRVDRYREEALRCHELAKHADPPFLGEFYRRVAVRYMFMAEEILNDARVRGELPPQGAAITNRPRRA